MTAYPWVVALGGFALLMLMSTVYMFNGCCHIRLVA